MRYLVLLALIIVLASCTAPPLYPTPTPTITPTPTPTITPTPTPPTLDSLVLPFPKLSGQWRIPLSDAWVFINRLKGMTDLAYRDIPSLRTSFEDREVHILCHVSNGGYAPDLVLTELTTDRRMLFAIRDYCKYKHVDPSFIIFDPTPIMVYPTIEFPR